MNEFVTPTLHFSKVHGANMGSIWVRENPGGLHGGPMNFAMWDSLPVRQRAGAIPPSDGWKEDAFPLDQRRL